MDEQMDLDGILNDKPPEQAPGEVPGEAPAAQPDPVRSHRKEFREKDLDARAAGEGKVRDPVTGQFVAKEEAKETPKEEPKKEAPKEVIKEEMTAKERALLAAAQDERNKRQRIEQEYNALKNAQPKTEQKPFLEDPDGNLRQLETNVQGALIRHKLDTAEMIARNRHTDFEEKALIFAELAKTTPGLYQQMVAAVDPGEFAYRIGKNHMELQQAGDLDKLREKIEKETRLKVEEEFKKKQEALEKERAAIPSSLSTARSTHQINPTWGGPTSLDEILK